MGENLAVRVVFAVGLNVLLAVVASEVNVPPLELVHVSNS